MICQSDADCERATRLALVAAQRADDAEAAIRAVRELVDESRVSVKTGCRCSTDECSGDCGAGEPLSWTLDPTEVRRALGEAQ